MAEEDKQLEVFKKKINDLCNKLIKEFEETLLKL